MASVTSWTDASSGSRLSFSLGPALGGGSAWLADDAATLWQLGPSLGSVQIKPAWSVNLLYDAPFKRAPFLVPPVSGANDTSQVVLLDRDGNFFSLNPASGQAARLGAVADADGAAFADPLTSGETLLSVMTNGLYASRLADGAPLWSFNDGGAILRAPVATGDTVILLTQDTTRGRAASGTIYALNLADGTVRWRSSLNGFISISSAVIRAGVVYIGTPAAAFDLASGRRLWQASPQSGASGIGGPALSESGDTLYMGVINGDGTGGVVALMTADGREHWHTSLGRDYLSAFETIWASGDRIIVPSGAGDSSIIGVDSQTGAVLWHYQPPTPRFGAITLASTGASHASVVWMILQNGHVLALDAENGHLAARFADFELALTTLSSVAQRPYVTADGTRVIVAMDTKLLGLAIEAVGRAP
jgi:outer membrane protein assembly factor BamB